jgi:hypothetical protein
MVNGSPVRVVDAVTEKKTIVCGIGVCELENNLEEYFGKGVLVNGGQNLIHAAQGLAEHAITLGHDLPTKLDYIIAPKDFLPVYVDIRNVVCKRVKQAHDRISQGILRGGPLNGSASGDALIGLGAKYNSIPLQQSRYPSAVYERIRGTNDFQWVATFESAKEQNQWYSIHENEWNYF